MGHKKTETTLVAHFLTMTVQIPLPAPADPYTRKVIFPSPLRVRK
ncbi:MAG: hypothetical protein ABSA50_01385 [Candidatus Bathyarchaeia archaeon]